MFRVVYTHQGASQEGVIRVYTHQGASQECYSGVIPTRVPPMGVIPVGYTHQGVSLPSTRFTVGLEDSPAPFPVSLLG